MWRLGTLLYCLVLLSACGSDRSPAFEPPISEVPPPAFSLQHQGLDGITITRLYQHYNMIFAVSSDGLYINNGNGNWLNAGLQGFDLEDVVLLSEQHFITATYQQDNDGYRQYLLFETYNGGVDWVEIKHQFGLHGETEAIHALLYDDTTQRLYATGTEALAFSNDQGISWQLLYGSWQGFGQAKSALALNRQHNEIWFGGQGAIENPVLLQVAVADGSAKQHNNLMPAPSSIYAVRYAPDKPDTVYVSGEGGIVQSNDNGTSWRPLLGDKNYRFYFDLAIDPANPQRIYTAGWDKKFDDPQPLIIEWTDNGGSSWEQYQHTAPASFFGGVRSMLLVEENGQKVLYLGLWKGGVMRVVPTEY